MKNILDILIGGIGGGGIKGDWNVTPIVTDVVNAADAVNATYNPITKVIQSDWSAVTPGTLSIGIIKSNMSLDSVGLSDTRRIGVEFTAPNASGNVYSGLVYGLAPASHSAEQIRATLAAAFLGTPPPTPYVIGSALHAVSANVTNVASYLHTDNASLVTQSSNVFQGNVLPSGGFTTGDQVGFYFRKADVAGDDVVDIVTLYKRASDNAFNLGNRARTTGNPVLPAAVVAFYGIVYYDPAAGPLVNMSGKVITTEINPSDDVTGTAWEVNGGTQQTWTDDFATTAIMDGITQRPLPPGTQRFFQYRAVIDEGYVGPEARPFGVTLKDKNVIVVDALTPSPSIRILTDKATVQEMVDAGVAAAVPPAVAVSSVKAGVQYFHVKSEIIGGPWITGAGVYDTFDAAYEAALLVPKYQKKVIVLDDRSDAGVNVTEPIGGKVYALANNNIWLSGYSRLILRRMDYDYGINFAARCDGLYLDNIWVQLSRSGGSLPLFDLSVPADAPFGDTAKMLLGDNVAVNFSSQEVTVSNGGTIRGGRNNKITFYGLSVECTAPIAVEMGDEASITLTGSQFIPEQLIFAITVSQTYKRIPIVGTDALKFTTTIVNGDWLARAFAAVAGQEVILRSDNFLQYATFDVTEGAYRLDDSHPWVISGVINLGGSKLYISGTNFQMRGESLYSSAIASNVSTGDPLISNIADAPYHITNLALVNGYGVAFHLTANGGYYADTTTSAACVLKDLRITAHGLGEIGANRLEVSDIIARGSVDTNYRLVSPIKIGMVQRGFIRNLNLHYDLGLCNKIFDLSTALIANTFNLDKFIIEDIKLMNLTHSLTPFALFDLGAGAAGHGSLAIDDNALVIGDITLLGGENLPQYVTFFRRDGNPYGYLNDAGIIIKSIPSYLTHIDGTIPVFSADDIVKAGTSNTVLKAAEYRIYGDIALPDAFQLRCTNGTRLVGALPARMPTISGNLSGSPVIVGDTTNINNIRLQGLKITNAGANAPAVRFDGQGAIDAAVTPTKLVFKDLDLQSDHAMLLSVGAHNNLTTIELDNVNVHSGNIHIVAPSNDGVVDRITMRNCESVVGHLVLGSYPPSIGGGGAFTVGEVVVDSNRFEGVAANVTVVDVIDGVASTLGTDTIKITNNHVRTTGTITGCTPLTGDNNHNVYMRGNIGFANTLVRGQLVLPSSNTVTLSAANTFGDVVDGSAVIRTAERVILSSSSLQIKDAGLRNYLVDVRTRVSCASAAQVARIAVVVDGSEVDTGYSEESIGLPVAGEERLFTAQFFLQLTKDDIVGLQVANATAGNDITLNDTRVTLREI